MPRNHDNWICTLVYVFGHQCGVVMLFENWCSLHLCVQVVVLDINFDNWIPTLESIAQLIFLGHEYGVVMFFENWYSLHLCVQVVILDINFALIHICMQSLGISSACFHKCSTIRGGERVIMFVHWLCVFLRTCHMRMQVVRMWAIDLQVQSCIWRECELDCELIFIHWSHTFVIWHILACMSVLVQWELTVLGFYISASTHSCGTSQAVGPHYEMFLVHIMIAGHTLCDWHVHTYSRLYL